MNLFISLVSLALAATAYWRSGGKQDVRRARLEIERLRSMQQEFAQNVAQSIAAAYDASRQRLQHAREVLRQTKEEAVRNLDEQITRIQDQIEVIARRLEEHARSVREATQGAAREIEQNITLRVRRLEARAMLLRAKARTTRAVNAAAEEDFQRADELLEDATELLREARATLGEDHAYDKLFESVKESLRTASLAVRAHAENAREKIEAVLADTDRLVGRLEADEQSESGRMNRAEATDDLRVAA